MTPSLASVSTIYLVPLTGNTSNLPYDPTKMLKQWAITQAMVLPGSDLVNDLFVVPNAAGGYSLPQQAVLGSDDITALTINAPAVVSTSVPQTPVTSPAPAPIPLDPVKYAALIASGGKLVGNGPMEAFEGGSAIFVQPATVGLPVPPSTEDPVLTEILADVRDIDKREGGTPE